MSRSASIRDFIGRNPEANNGEVIDGLAREGVSVTANLVNQVRHDYKHKKSKDLFLAASCEDDEPLLRVKKLSDELGGVDKLIQLAFLLQKLT